MYSFLLLFSSFSFSFFVSRYDRRIVCAIFRHARARGSRESSHGYIQPSRGNAATASRKTIFCFDCQRNQSSRSVSRFNIYVALRYAALSVVAATTRENTGPPGVLPLCSDGRTSLIKRRSRARSEAASAFF